MTTRTPGAQRLGPEPHPTVEQRKNPPRSLTFGTLS